VIRVYKKLPLDSVANIFNGFAYFAACLAQAFLDITFYAIGAALGFEFFVVDGSANRFFSFAFNLIEFAFNFVSVW
jgi:hypothetical protein